MTSTATIASPSRVTLADRSRRNRRSEETVTRYEYDGLFRRNVYPCNEGDSWSSLVDTVGSLHFAPMGNGPGTSGGICQGARWLEYGSWFERAHNSVFNPGTSKPLAVSLWFEPSSPYGFQALFSKSGEYELILQTGKMVLRVASNTGGGSWDKEVEVSHSITSGWHHALFWIEPGVEIGLCLDGGTPETEGLAAGQAARVINGGVLIGYPPPPEPSSSWQWSSSYFSSSYFSSSYYPSSSWAMDAELLSTPSPYEGLVDEIAVFNEALNAGWRAALYGGGWGLFWHADHDDWGPCQWSSSSWNWSSSYYYSSSYYSSYYSSWPSSWAMREDRSSKPGKKSASPVTSGLLALASDGDPDRVLTQYVWGARPGHRDELVLRDRATVSSEELDERLYCLMDYFDPTSAVDTEGEVVERYGFSAFGVREVMAADWSSRAQSWFAWEFGFHGQFLDTETGYYNYGYRYYVPKLGRWVNRDPIGEEGGMNLYAFVGNNPAGSLDYLGLKQFTVNETFSQVPGARGNDADTSISKWIVEAEVTYRDESYHHIEVTKAEAVALVNAGMGNAKHEQAHVNDYKSAWGELLNIANGLDGSAYCEERVADCYKTYLLKARIYSLRYGSYLGEWGHVNGTDLLYPPNQRELAKPALARAEREKNAAKTEMDQQKTRCELMESGQI